MCSFQLWLLNQGVTTFVFISKFDIWQHKGVPGKEMWSWWFPSLLQLDLKKKIKTDTVVSGCTSFGGRGFTWLNLSKNEIWMFKKKVLWHPFPYWIRHNVCTSVSNETGWPLSVWSPSHFFLWTRLWSWDKRLLQRLYLLASGAAEALWETERDQDQSVDTGVCAQTYLYVVCIHLKNMHICNDFWMLKCVSSHKILNLQRENHVAKWGHLQLLCI